MNDIDQTPLPTPAEAAAMLVEASAIDVDTDRGETIELWTIASEGDTLSASGPRLAVAGGMTVTCRLSQDGMPILVEAVIEEAEFRSQARASLTLRVTDVATHGYRRRTERLSLHTAASLRALVCDRIVPGEVIPVTLTDLSAAGCAVSMTDTRPREGDRMTLTARFLEGEVTADVRIMRVHSPTPDVYTVGCRFIAARALAQGVLERVLHRLGGNARPAPAVATVREPAAEHEAEKSLKPKREPADDAYWTFAKRPVARIHTARRAV
jgi:PilZ domain